MTVDPREWFSETLECLQSGDESTARCLLRAGYFWYAGAFLSVTRRYPLGTNVFDRDWDALVVLDACRVDALRAVASEYDFLEDIGAITSVGSMTPEWMSQTFTTDHLDDISRTGYLVGNGFIERVLDENGHTGSDALPIGPKEYDVVDRASFSHLEPLWNASFEPTSEWMVGEGSGERLHPRYVTERAIHAGRTADVDRLIVHYNYPHEPYPLAPERLVRPFEALSSGAATRDEVWEAYLENLRFVLDDVGMLLNNLDAEKVVITADHGEAFGEYGFYQHLIGCPVPCVRRVPWVETRAEDTGERTVTAPDPLSISKNKSMKEHMEDLGYL